MKQIEFPIGWDEERVQRVLDHYETQTEEEALEEDEAMFEGQARAVMEIPEELIPMVRELIARYQVEKEAHP
jgi:hypothetical protein